MKTWKVSNTQIQDLDTACQLYHDAIAFQKRKGYPEYRCDDRANQEKFINLGRHYKIMEGDQIAGIFNLQPTDKEVWRDMDTGNEIYLHGVLIDSRYKGQKLFNVILDWVVKLGKSQGKSFIRLDTWDNNPKLENYYLSFGFKVVERFQHSDGDSVSPNCRGNKVVLLEYAL